MPRHIYPRAHCADAYDMAWRDGGGASSSSTTVEEALRRDAGTLFDPSVVAAALRVGR